MKSRNINTRGSFQTHNRSNRYIIKTSMSKRKFDPQTQIGTSLNLKYLHIQIAKY
jgi:hypothetical protein